METNREKNNILSRRAFLMGAATLAGVTLVACGSGAPGAAPAEEAAAAAPAAAGGFTARSEAWKSLPADHKKGELITQADWYKILGEPPAEIEAAFWLEGWGHGWVKDVAAQLEEAHAGAKVKVWGDPRIWETLQPRLVAGDVPDVGRLWISGGQAGQIGGTVDGVYVPVDILLDVEAPGQPGKRLEEILAEGALVAASMGITEHQWSMPFSQTQSGIYYNAALFEKNGWPQPDALSWEDFMALHEDILKSGVAPWTYQGKYPGYFDIVNQPLIYKKAGQKAVCDIDNLVEGAWKNPDVMWALEQLPTIFKNGWVAQGAEAMTHTEGQQLFVDGKAAMVPCGTWLQREQEETTPKDFRMKLSSIPAPKDGKGFAKAVANAADAALVVGNGKNPLWGMEYLRWVYSARTAKYIAEQVGGMLAVQEPLAGATVNEAVQSAVDAVTAAEGNYPTWYFGAWYPNMGKLWGDSYGDYLWGKLTVEELTNNMERSAREAREDDTMKKYSRTDCA